jgi:hypothetical protein
MADINPKDLNGIGAGETVESLAKRHKVSVAHIKAQLKQGTEVEREHTDKTEVARKIAIDHVYEDPDYYTKLEQMENEDIKESKTLSYLKSLARQLDEAQYGDRDSTENLNKDPDRYKGMKPSEPISAERKAALKAHYDKEDEKRKKSHEFWTNRKKEYDAAQARKKAESNSNTDVKKEDAPVNNVGMGNIAGATKDNQPGVNPKKKKPEKPAVRVPLNPDGGGGSYNALEA